MSNRFDLEQQILKAWNITDDIQLLYEKVMDDEMSKDDIANALLGILNVSNLRFEKCWSTFEEVVRSRELD